MKKNKINHIIKVILISFLLSYKIMNKEWMKYILKAKRMKQNNRTSFHFNKSSQTNKIYK